MPPIALTETKVGDTLRSINLWEQPGFLGICAFEQEQIQSHTKHSDVRACHIFFSFFSQYFFCGILLLKKKKKHSKANASPRSALRRQDLRLRGMAHPCTPGCTGPLFGPSP